MARLYADEQFPQRIVELLRELEHDVLTVQEAGKRELPDESVLDFATKENRAVLTLNRWDFIWLHEQQPNHAGILACKDDSDREKMTNRIHEAIASNEPLAGKLIRVNRTE
ncbi:MAG: DUF5615 family PIN-like protein [Leptolyngbyaceae cyanobacterium RU_5_1]|nr:DUF5615 family PIN-like protein [Leptolyngbyaceae cyanobacterium RU_5_1]